MCSLPTRARSPHLGSLALSGRLVTHRSRRLTSQFWTHLDQPEIRRGANGTTLGAADLDPTRTMWQPYLTPMILAATAFRGGFPRDHGNQSCCCIAKISLTSMRPPERRL